MRLFSYLFLFVFALSPVISYAQEEDEMDDELGFVEEEEAITPESGVQSFGSGADSWRRKDDIQQTHKLEMIKRVSDYITPSAIENLMHPEQVFCYKVAGKPKGYAGYTIDGLALVSFCGVLEENQKTTLIDQLFTRDENISADIENCIIKPQMLFRFVRGVDFTDVLISSPCHSYTVFYAGSGNIHTYNLSPIASLVDQIIELFNQQTRDFASPALLQQLLPIGIPQDENQQRLIDESNGPIRNWQRQQEQEQAENARKNRGWNKLKFK